MQISQLVTKILKYLPILAVLAVTIIGLMIGKDVYLTTLNSQSATNNQQLLPIPEAVSSCVVSSIYMSLPPKCKTSDGKFVPVPGTPEYNFVIPESK